MTFYFSGTGNSTYTAITLSNLLGENLYFIPSVDLQNIEPEGERILFVFPVYSWGVPPLVLKFIRDLGDKFWTKVKSSNINVDCVMTCGDETALAPEILIRALRKEGVELNSVWSVIMPNNYVLLPGFDVDKKNIEESKLQSCEGRILEIAEGLKRGDKRIDVTRGNLAWLKTRIVYPLFKKWGVFPQKWHYTDKCISCGNCEKICPLRNITMIDSHPEWGQNCCSCLGCYHVCPVHAVAYGKETRSKGQYLFPLKKISSLNFHK